MTAALICDGCGEKIIDPERAKRWWRAERVGLDAIPEIGSPLISPLPLDLNLTMNDYDDDGYDASPEIGVDSRDIEALPEITVHFCKAACGAKWFNEAAALDAD